MPQSSALRAGDATPSSELVYARIGTFLVEQRLAPNPTNYTFAYHVVAEPEGVLAQNVARLTDGGVRLTMRDIESLGADIDATPTTGAHAAELLVAQTQMQVDGLSDIVQAMQAETRDFERDLTASADAIAERRAEDTAPNPALDHLAQITADMLRRIAESDARLARADQEARDLREKLEEARADALTDPLTGLPNRRAFERTLADLDMTEPFVIAMCDVDHFKSVNDRFGHSVGDRVLRAIADALRGACHPHLVTRYGGEEFAILLHCPIAEAHAIVEEARRQIAAKRYRLRESDAPLGEVTVSAGLSIAREGDVPSSVVHRADRLMYLAKGNGRNRVMHDHMGEAQ